MKYAPGSWLAVLGGGQLGRMFCHSAQALGYKVLVLDPGEHSPAGAVADYHLRAAYDDSQALQYIANNCVAATTEFENVPAASMAYLAQSILVTPGADCVAIAQDRLVEKASIQNAGVAVADYAAISATTDVDNCADNLFPGILKTARFGYDGKGQVRVANRAEAKQAFADLGAVQCILESLQPLDYEISVVVARDTQSNVITYPPAKNLHVNGILDLSLLDGSIPASVAQQAKKYALQIANAINYQGVLCIEFFVLQSGAIIANEMAPRPHNSGHYTQNACQTSQFEQQARIMAGLPLGQTDIFRPAAMLNLLGDLWFDANNNLVEPNWDQVLQIPHTSLHLYDKSEARKARKMGHINLTAPDSTTLHHNIALVRAALGQ